MSVDSSSSSSSRCRTWQTKQGQNTWRRQQLLLLPLHLQMIQLLLVLLTVSSSLSSSSSLLSSSQGYQVIGTAARVSNKNRALSDLFTPQVICENQTSILTCDHDVAPSAEDVCHFVGSDFRSWEFQQQTVTDTTRSTMTLTKCLSDPVCVFECLSMSCTRCITLEGLPCGQCYEKDELQQQQQQNDQQRRLKQYTIAFSICDSADAVISCPMGTAAVASQPPHCDFPASQFSNSNSSTNADGTLYQLSLQGCNQPRCSAACTVPSMCMCVQNDATTCGSNCPYPPPPTTSPPASTMATTLPPTVASTTNSLSTSAVPTSAPTILQQAFSTATSPSPTTTTVAATTTSPSPTTTTAGATTTTLPPSSSVASSSSSSFQICALSSATITCRNNNSSSTFSAACQYNMDDFQQWSTTIDSTNTTTLTLEECKQDSMSGGGGACNVTCADTDTAPCSCVGPDGVTPCGVECENDADLYHPPSSSLLVFGLCNSTSALITCNSGSLSACNFKASDFSKWNVTINNNNESLFSLEGCRRRLTDDDDGARCEVDCQVDQCSCVDLSDGSSGCSLCDANGTVVIDSTTNTTSDTNDDDIVSNLNDYPQSFQVCASTSAVIQCQDTSLDVCKYNQGDFEDSNVTAYSKSMIVLELNGCRRSGSSFCPVGCSVDMCICIEKETAKPCGVCDDGTTTPPSSGTGGENGGEGTDKDDDDDDDILFAESKSDVEVIPGENITFYTAKDAIISCPRDSICDYTATEFVNITMMGSEWSSVYSVNNGNGNVFFSERDVLKFRGCRKGPSSSAMMMMDDDSIDVSTNQDRTLDLGDGKTCNVTCSSPCICMTAKGETCSLQQQDAAVTGMTSGSKDAKNRILWDLATTGLGMVLVALG